MSSLWAPVVAAMVLAVMVGAADAAAVRAVLRCRVVEGEGEWWGWRWRGEAAMQAPSLKQAYQWVDL